MGKPRLANVDETSSPWNKRGGAFVLPCTEMRLLIFDQNMRLVLHSQMHKYPHFHFSGHASLGFLCIFCFLMSRIDSIIIEGTVYASRIGNAEIAGRKNSFRLLGWSWISRLTRFISISIESCMRMRSVLASSDSPTDLKVWAGEPD